VANPDAVNVTEDSTSANLVPALLANDTDPNAGDTKRITAVGTTGTVGTVVFNAVAQTLTYSADAAAQDALGAGATSTDTFNYTVSDGAGLTSSTTVTVTLTGANDAPVLVTPIADQTATEDAAFSFTVSNNAFADVDVGDTLTYGATRADGTALPTWLTFDAATRTLSGTPSAADTGNFGIRVTATDQGGLSTSDSFALNVVPANAITGTSSSDTLIGTDGVDVVLGLDGGDIIVGNGGNDVISGGAGDDNLDGGAGDDTFLVQGSEDGNDGVEGGAGFDQIVGGSGDDVIGLWDHQGTRTVERIDGGAGVNVISGTPGFDNLDFSGTALLNIARIEGGDGGDNIVGSAGNDVIVGGLGDDNLDGGAGDDTFLVQGSEDGTDAVQGGEGFDQILGGSGDDVIGLWDYQGTRTVERIDGGAGVNIISSTGGSDSLDFSATTLVNITRIEGGEGADRITGSAGNDTLDGGADDNDVLAGGTGDDTYLLGRGYGADDIEDNDSTAGNTDIGQFLAGVSADQIWFQQTGDDLVASIVGTSDRFTVRNWYLDSDNHLEEFRTADGSTLLDSNVQNLVNAMAAFAPPAPGQETLPSDYAAALNPVIAANWQ
jgi:VCBS repeat-containing protein